MDTSEERKFAYMWERELVALAHFLDIDGSSG